MFSGLRLHHSESILAVNDLLEVQGLERKKHLSCIKLALFFAELVFNLQQTIEFSAGAVLQDKVKLLFILEGEIEAHQERMVHTCENLPLRHDLLLKVQLGDMLLLNLRRFI